MFFHAQFFSIFLSFCLSICNVLQINVKQELLTDSTLCFLLHLEHWQLLCSCDFVTLEISDEWLCAVIVNSVLLSFISNMFLYRECNSSMPPNQESNKAQVFSWSRCAQFLTKIFGNFPIKMQQKQTGRG